MKKNWQTTILLLTLLAPCARAATIGPITNDTSYSDEVWMKLRHLGLTPYHLLEAEDFQVKNLPLKVESAMTEWFTQYGFDVDVTDDRQPKATISHLEIRSGFDSTQSWRSRALTDPRVYLKHEQGHLDINEIYARKLKQELSVGDLEATGHDRADAIRKLDLKITTIYNANAKLREDDEARYDLETNGGLDPVAQSKWNRLIEAELHKAGVAEAGAASR